MANGKYWLIGKLLGHIGKKTDGHKTKGAGVAALLASLNGVIGLVWPDLGLLPMTIGEIVTAAVTGLGLLGIGGKLQKSTEATEAQTEVLKKNGV